MIRVRGPVRVTAPTPLPSNSNPLKKRRSPIPAPIAKAVWARDGLCCRYCAWKSKDARKFQLDHIKPYSKGGEHSVYNLVVACRECNIIKGTETNWVPIPLKKIDSYRHNLQRAAKGKPIVWKPDPRCRPYGLPKDKRHVRTNPPNPPEPSGRPVIRSAGPK